jgi:hypothetical protein
MSDSQIKQLKLFHWHIDTPRYASPPRFVCDYLVMTSDVETARKILIAQVNSPGGIVAKQMSHDKLIEDRPPTFVADTDYPIVIQETDR